MEPVDALGRPMGVDEYSEDLPGPGLPAWAERYLAQERMWHRLLRGAGAITGDEARDQLRQWL
ncbi:hypothetical protein [Mycolicibacterium farcinogenes]|uniref:Uncharacterized protein n=1 Tax=Mycolicibacterium farcinogenes TaxID=1802 RepID=A0ACD1FQN0_MYCFR|nr:hypothetical protein [Mycolicibacterium farcinogenes]QZH69359.1 hypothetical protein K6L26_23950 [Mycolicibacterium farcinogenes]